MHEIECILHEYLSFNWDRVEDIYDANSVYLSENGLKCSWHSSHHLSVGTHSILLTCPNCLRAMDPAQRQHNTLLLSLHSNSLSSDVEDLHSPSSAHGSLNNLQVSRQYPLGFMESSPKVGPQSYPYRQ